MEVLDFLEELNLVGKAVAITRVSVLQDSEQLPSGCTLSLLKKAMDGQQIVSTLDNGGCYGGKTGFGITDDIPATPGGFGYFLSYGKGEGYPAGERIKRDPELADRFIVNQPQDVLGEHNAVCFEVYEDAQSPELVSFLVTPDQLAALVHVYNYEKIDYDNVIAPMTSGCASIVRIPLAEREKGADARAVIGNIDIFSRPHFPADTFFFTISNESFEAMLAYADETIFASPIWKPIRKRIHGEA